MSLLDEARAAEHRPGGLCSVARFLPDADLEEALEAVRDRKLQGSALERALTKRGNPLKADTIRRHVRGECSCDAA